MRREGTTSRVSAVCRTVERIVLMARNGRHVGVTAALLLAVMVGSIASLPRQAMALGQTPAHLAAAGLSERMDAFVRGLVAKHQFSGAVLVVRRGVVLLDKGYGWADATRHLPNTPATEYRIGS